MQISPATRMILGWAAETRKQVIRKLWQEDKFVLFQLVVFAPLVFILIVSEIASRLTRVQHFLDNWKVDSLIVLMLVSGLGGFLTSAKARSEAMRYAEAPVLLIQPISQMTRIRGAQFLAIVLSVLYFCSFIMVLHVIGYFHPIDYAMTIWPLAGSMMLYHAGWFYHSRQSRNVEQGQNSAYFLTQDNYAEASDGTTEKFLFLPDQVFPINLSRLLFLDGQEIGGARIWLKRIRPRTLCAVVLTGLGLFLSLSAEFSGLWIATTSLFISERLQYWLRLRSMFGPIVRLQPIGFIACTLAAVRLPFIWSLGMFVALASAGILLGKATTSEAFGALMAVCTLALFYAVVLLLVEGRAIIASFIVVTVVVLLIQNAGFFREATGIVGVAIALFILLRARKNFYRGVNQRRA